MNASVATPRGGFQGVTEIIAFNWHWYVLGAGAVALGCALVWRLDTTPLRVGGLVACALAAFWTVASLAVSFWVYDHSPLRSWLWIPRAIDAPAKTWCNIHCGLDESSEALRKIFPKASATVLDVFDEREMDEASIARARAHQAGLPAVRASFARLPVETASHDAVFILFAAHELRSGVSREALFREVRRILVAGGRAIVAEHMRDVQTFCAFGPGAFHFFPRREWLRVFNAASLQVADEFNITPFVRVFVLRRTP